MNKRNSKCKWLRKKMNSQFEDYSFEELKETLLEKIKDPEEKKTEKNLINMKLKDDEMDISHIAHLYLGISRKAAEFLVNYEKETCNLEKGYSSLLKLISETVKLKPLFQEKNSIILVTQREKDTQHLWKNRELCNEAMNHYVRQIQNRRDKRHRKYIIIFSIIVPIIVSLIIPLIIPLIIK